MILKSDKMVIWQKSKVQTSTGLQMGEKYVPQSKINIELGPQRKLANLSEARSIKEAGWYWISAEGTQIKEGVWKGLPKETGNYKDNKDGTFTKIPKNAKLPDRSKCLCVSDQAAAKAAALEGPLALIIRPAGFGLWRLLVVSDSGDGNIARVASVPQASIEEVAQQAVRKE